MLSDELLSNRLLVIDDDDAFARFVEKVARSLGFEVVAVSDPNEFKMTAKAWAPTLVILDLNMPGCDGVELLRHLALMQCGAHVVVASGLDDRTLEATVRLGAERGLKMGGALAKPARLQTVRDLLTKFVAIDSNALTDELAEAIKNDQLFLQYQPKLDCRAGRMTAVEALVRWKHPSRGIIPPDQFIALAEASGLIDGLTDWVIRTAARQSVEWRAQGLLLEIAVNISAQNTQDIDLPDRLVRLCEAEGANPAHMILELTETSAMRDAVQMMDVLTRLRVKGFRLSIDDFGTGYSSLVQLQRMPFSETKVDRSFVMQMNRSKDCRVIVEIVIDLARKLGLTCVAEGVENQGILDELMKLGCDAAQGYHLSRPVDAARIPEVVQGYADMMHTAAA
ncbi:MAG TPA: EAL domain-containing response regulator [Stellaceae bacterium]|nr:EAL domain-containing response regulator [Stellaceae bacterium]